MEHWRNDDTENSSTERKKLSRCNIFHHISHMRSKLVLRGESPVNNRVNGGTAEMPIKQSHSHIKKERQLEKRKMWKTILLRKAYPSNPFRTKKRGSNTATSQSGTATDTVVAPYILKILVKSEWKDSLEYAQNKYSIQRMGSHVHDFTLR